MKNLKNKISILSLHMGYGGIEKTIVDQANMLCENYEVEIISLYKLNDKIPYELNSKVKLNYLSNLKPNREEFKEALRNKKIIKVFKEGFKALKVLYLKKYLVKKYIINSRAKIIISTRIDFTKLLNRYENKNAIKIAEEHVYHKNDLNYINELRNNLNNIDYLLLPSEYLYNDYKKYFKDEKVKIKYIPLTINTLPKTLNKCEGNNIISVCRFSPEKGLKDLIEVFNLVNKENKDIKLTLVGGGSEFNKIENLINKYNLNKKVKLTGYLNQKELMSEYKKADLYLMTSFEESFGLVLVEAMGHGIPAIAFDSALGACEIINNKNGKLIQNRDKELMSKEILSYFNKKNKSAMIKEARKTSEKYYIENVREEWIKFIKSILK